VDRGRGDGRVSFRNAELMQVGNDVACRVKAIHRCTLLPVDFYIAGRVAPRAERFCQSRET
jgi:hypothetical protein